MIGLVVLNRSIESVANQYPTFKTRWPYCQLAALKQNAPIDFYLAFKLGQGTIQIRQ